MSITIALDAMGGDHGPSVIVPAALSALEHERKIELILVGDSETLTRELSRHGAGESARVSIQHASQTVGMDEAPAQALRRKKDSSMRVAINLVRDGGAQACVSAGNTGALMATARFVLKTLPGIDRPAIVSTLPTCSGRVHVLDLGANVDSPAHLLLQFAIMGSIMVRHVDGVAEPKVALLNIGVEDIKGNDTIRRAAELLRRSRVNFLGYVEGDAIYTGDADVIVCDGFVGNVALKTSEGLAQMITSFLRQEFERSPWTRAVGALSRPMISALGRRVDHRRYNGAALLGLRGTVIKSHGGADALAFEHAVLEAMAVVEHRVPERISAELAPMLGEVSAA